MQVREFLYFAAIGFARKPRKILRQARKSWFLREGGWLWYLTTLLLAFGGNLILANINGRLCADSDPYCYNYLEDWPNLINYTIICPAYVCSIIYYIRNSWDLPALMRANLSNILKINSGHFYIGTVGKIFWSLVTIGMIVLVQTLYSKDVKLYDFDFWFEVEEFTGPFMAALTLGYYNFVNFIFLLLWLWVTWEHIKYVHVSIAISRGFDKILKRKASAWVGRFPQEKQQVEKIFTPIVNQYLVSKLLIILATANLYTWKAQGPHGYLGALDLTILILAFGGMLLISFPRYQIQYYMLQVRLKQGETTNIDIRNHIQIGWANLFDVIIFGSAISNLLLFVLEKI